MYNITSSYASCKDIDIEISDHIDNIVITILVHVD